MFYHSPLSLAVAATLLLGSQSTCQTKGGGSWEDALARYKEVKQRLPFRYHTEGRERIASTHRPEALELLVRDYAKPWSYPEYTRYTIAHLIENDFNDARFVPVLEVLRKKFDDPVDMWMWVHVLRIRADAGQDDAVAQIALEDRKPLHRAAAILALGLSRKGRIKSAIVGNCVDFPRKEADRNALLGAMSGALWTNRRYVNDEDYRAALTAYIGLLEEGVKLTHTAKIQMARHLQWILGGPALFVNPEPWLEILQRGEVKKPKGYATRAVPSFCGIQTDGDRFCYVIDMSDSMCKEIEPSARPSNAPITGPRPKRKKGFVPSESDLPWHLIKTRWDLAREELRISLLRLTNDKYFSVVWFGTDSGTLDSCKGMIKATARNVDRVLAELDKIQPGPPDAVKSPDGTLRGGTNLHGGLRRAFGMTKKGYVDEAAYVDPKALTEGCDTIFLLSDGAPSWDDFHIKDRDYGEGKVVVDTEYGAAGKRTPNLIYHGPYSQDPRWLVEDVRRMNAFRRIRMHCVGLGEANMKLLRDLAKACNGETFSIGARKSKRGSK